MVHHRLAPTKAAPGPQTLPAPCVCAYLQASPLMAGLSVAAVAYAGKQMVQLYTKIKASPGLASVGKQFYKVGGGGRGLWGRGESEEASLVGLKD